MQNVKPVEVLTYYTKAGDTFDTLALDLYSEERLAPLLMDYNRDHIDTLIFEAGVRLRLPVFASTAPAISLPPWRR